MERKSNFHDREWIMNEVKKKYETAVAYYGSEDFVIGAFLVGSQNYNLDIESSDVDVKVYTLPSIESIIENGKPESSTWVQDDGSHIDYKDFRLVISELEKGSPNMLETLFTDYYIINRKYLYLISRLRAYRERIAIIDQNRTFNALRGMAQRFINIYNINKEEMDSKDLVTLLRIRDFIYSYFILEDNYKKALVSPNISILRTLRENKVDLDKLKIFVDEAIRDLDEYEEFFKSKLKNERRERASLGKAVLHDILYDLMFTFLKDELKNFEFVSFTDWVKNGEVLI